MTSNDQSAGGVESEKFQNHKVVAAIVETDDLSHEDRVKAFDEIARLIDAGVPATQAIDLYAVDVLGLDPEKWGEWRGTSAKSITTSAYKGRETLMEDL